jgi:hypothetical protein
VAPSALAISARVGERTAVCGFMALSLIWSPGRDLMLAILPSC